MLLGAEDELHRAVLAGHQVAVVDRPDDALRVAAVVGPAVHGEREVGRIALAAAHPVGAGRIDRGVLVEGVGVVPAPLLVRPHDLDEAGPGPVGPHLGLQADVQDGEHPPVALEDGGLVRQGPVAPRAQADLEGAERVDQPPDGRRRGRRRPRPRPTVVGLILGEVLRLVVGHRPSGQDSGRAARGVVALGTVSPAPGLYYYKEWPLTVANAPDGGGPRLVRGRRRRSRVSSVSHATSATVGPDVGVDEAPQRGHRHRPRPR